MSKTKLLIDAIADAKSLKEHAHQTALLQLKEAFAPRMQRMISSRLQEEDDDEMEIEDAPVEEGDEDEFSDDEISMEESDDMESEDEITLDEEDEESEPETEPEPEPEPETEPEAEVEESADEMEDVEDDAELEEILRELEEEADSSDIGAGDNRNPSYGSSSSTTEDPGKNDLFENDDEEEEFLDEEEDEAEPSEDDEVLESILRRLREEDEVEPEAEAEPEAEETKEPTSESVRKLRRNLKEAYRVIDYLRNTINEQNLLNSKLLFSGKLFRRYSLTEGQKRKVIENFDRAGTLREVKLVYATLSESIKTASANRSTNKTSIKSKNRGAKRNLREVFSRTASRPTKSTRPSRILTEGADVQNRLLELAGITKKK
jgi:hypothetical protein